MDPEFDELKREFLAEARSKVDEMESVFSGDEAKALERLVYIAHQLKGSGGSYGFRQISTEAAEIERLAEDATGDWKADHADSLRKRLEKLREVIDAQRRDLG